MCRCIKVARIEEVPRNGMKLVKINDLEILIINIDGVFQAYDNRCPHMGYPLFFGRLEGHALTCGFHYAKFDVRSGEPLNDVVGKPLRKISLERVDSDLIIHL